MSDRVELKAIADTRIMADGRPAYAWWNEIQMLRAKEPELSATEQRLKEQFILLKICEWAFSQDLVSGDILIRVRRDFTLTTERHPEMELVNHPEKYCSIAAQERPK